MPPRTLLPDASAAKPARFRDALDRGIGVVSGPPGPAKWVRGNSGRTAAGELEAELQEEAPTPRLLALMQESSGPAGGFLFIVFLMLLVVLVLVCRTMVVVYRSLGLAERMHGWKVLEAWLHAKRSKTI